MKRKKSRSPAKPTGHESDLTPDTLDCLNLLFAPQDRQEAMRLLAEECGNNLPFLERASSTQLDRFRYAALRLSNGDLKELRAAVSLERSEIMND